MRLFDAQWVSGNIFIRQNRLTTAGDVVEGHKHNFDHTTIVWRGRIRIRANLALQPVPGEVLEVEKGAGEHVLIRAGVEHEITALDDDTVFWCVYSHRDPQGTVTQHYTGWAQAIV